MMRLLHFLTIFLIGTMSVFAQVQTYLDPDKPIQLALGQLAFNIELTANHTTGYIWFLDKYDKNVLHLKKYTYIEQNTDKVGAPGRDHWEFTINQSAFLEPTTLDINFIYARPWNFSDQRLRTVTIQTR